MKVDQYSKIFFSNYYHCKTDKIFHSPFENSYQLHPCHMLSKRARRRKFQRQSLKSETFQTYKSHCQFSKIKINFILRAESSITQRCMRTKDERLLFAIAECRNITDLCEKVYFHAQKLLFFYSNKKLLFFVCSNVAAIMKAFFRHPKKAENEFSAAKKAIQQVNNFIIRFSFGMIYESH